MNKLKFILAASLAAALTLSCSSGDDEGGGGGGGSTTETFTLKNVKDDQFTYVEAWEDDDCTEGGVLKIEKDTYENTVNYSIKNNIMTWDRWSDTLNFKGTSNELIGTWTRAKNRNASCELHKRTYCPDGEYYDDMLNDYVCKNNNTQEYQRYSCKEDWNLTEAVFTQTTVKITYEYCVTDRMADWEPWREGEPGWKSKPISCDTYEVSKGSEKVTIKQNRNGIEVSSKGETCKRSKPSESQMRAACQKAWNEHKDEEYWDEYYYEILYSAFEDCLLKSMPKGFYVVDDDDDYGKVAAKPVAKAKAKAKFAPLWKNRD